MSIGPCTLSQTVLYHSVSKANTREKNNVVKALSMSGNPHSSLTALCELHLTFDLCEGSNVNLYIVY